VPPAFVLAQLSDPHIGAGWGGPDTVERLAAAVDSIRALRDRPHAVLVTGDIADTASPDEYVTARELLARVGVPVYALPGNHDDRAGLRRAFELPGDGDEPVQYTVDVGPLRLVVADTVCPGADHGELDADRLAWLDETLAALSAPTVVALHHPPIALGVPVWDEIGLLDRAALAGVIERHPHVQAVLGGHIHRAITAPFAGRVAMSVPSTYMQGELDFGADTIELVDEPPMFALHTFTDGVLVSHLQPVERFGPGRT
jgi:3',5'-cyclic AMP phosphodiesterase CpdA